MRIGIDISQIVFEGSGVARYVQEMVRNLTQTDTKNDYILFGVSLRQKKIFRDFFYSLQKRKNIRLVTIPLPLSFIEYLWNQLHLIPIEWFIGSIDLFWSSDWTQPPLRTARGVTTIHDLSIYQYPESFSDKIIHVHKRKLAYSKEICSVFFCDSEATKYDAEKILKIHKEKLYVIYPGYYL